jgi:dTDP-4-amino-4,6-dideoxygalactose transaminase
MIKIPFNNLQLTNIKYKRKFQSFLTNCINSSNFIKGKYNKLLEKLIKEQFSIKYTLLVNSGTDALIIAIKVLDLKKGDEVITTANTWISSAYAVALNGATPVFVDINEENFQMDINSFKKKINKKTKALIVTHLYGCPNDMDVIKKICKRSNIKIIEDAAQAHMAKYKNKIVGNFGDIAILSFYPSKNLGALGDGGAIITNSRSLYKQSLLFANYGSNFFKDIDHKIIGINSRLDELQAAFLSEKIKDIKQDIKRRNALAKIYDLLCANIGIKSIKIPSGSLSSYHLYPVIIKSKRDLVKKLLLKKGIECQIHYKKPIHLQTAFKYLNYKKKSLPITEKISNQILSLPFYSGISNSKIQYIFNTLRNITKTTYKKI